MRFLFGFVFRVYVPSFLESLRMGNPEWVLEQNLFFPAIPLKCSLVPSLFFLKPNNYFKAFGSLLCSSNTWTSFPKDTGQRLCNNSPFSHCHSNMGLAWGMWYRGRWAPLSALIPLRYFHLFPEPQSARYLLSTVSHATTLPKIIRIWFL